MKIKLDENFGHSFTSIFLDAGFDTHSVIDEGLSGIKDDSLFEIIKTETRCLITFDLDFANIIRYPTDKTSGIIVIRPRRPVSFTEIENLCRQLIQFLKSENPAGCLRILDGEKLRVRKPGGDS